MVIRLFPRFKQFARLHLSSLAGDDVNLGSRWSLTTLVFFYRHSIENCFNVSKIHLSVCQQHRELRLINNIQQNYSL